MDRAPAAGSTGRRYHAGDACRVHRRRVRAVGQDGRAGRRRRRARPGARADPAGPEAPVDVFLPRYRGDDPAGRRARPGAASAVPRSATPPNGDRREVDRRRRRGPRIPASAGRPSAGIRPGRLLRRAGGDDYPDNAWRFGLLCRAALETLRADGRPVDVIHLHDWHAAPAVLLRDRFYADDPVIGPAAALLTIHNLAYHGWSPRDRLGELGLARATAVVGRRRGRDRPAPGGHRAGRDGQHRQPRLRRRGAHARVRDGPGRRPSRARRPSRPDGTPRFLGILNGLDTDALGSGDRRRPGRALSARPTRPARPPAGPTSSRRHGMDPDDPGPVLGMIGRLDPQKGFDLLADAAPGLVGLGARIIVQGSGDARLADAFRALAAARPEPVALVERFDRANARRIYAGSDLLPHAVALRAVRPGPDDRAALRHARRSSGGPAAWATRSSTRPSEPGEGTASSSTTPTPDALLARLPSGRSPSAAATARRPGWRAMVDRGMALDFGWETGSAPRYAAAYRGAIDAPGGGAFGWGEGAQRRQRSEGAQQERHGGRSMWVRCGECGPSATVRTWSAPIRSREARRASRRASGCRRRPRPGRPRSGSRRPPGRRAAASPASQSPFPRRTAIAAVGTTWVSDSALTICSPSGQSGFCARDRRRAALVQGGVRARARVVDHRLEHGAVHDRRVEQDDPGRPEARSRKRGRDHRAPAVADHGHGRPAASGQAARANAATSGRGLGERGTRRRPRRRRSGRAPGGPARRPGSRVAASAGPTRQNVRADDVTPWMRRSGRPSGGPHSSAENRTRPASTVVRSRPRGAPWSIRIASAAAGGRSSSVARIGAGNAGGVGAGRGGRRGHGSRRWRAGRTVRRSAGDRTTRHAPL